MKQKEYLKQIDRVIKNGPFTDTWESLCLHKTPEWYTQDKFGIFIHWGIYSVPAYKSEWYARMMYLKDSPEYKYHVEKFGPVDKFGYKDFIPMFKGEKFDADEWADLFVESGAKFVMPVAEHHDGFQMYKSDLSKWNSVEMGPKKDILAEVKSSVEKRNLKFCASSHRAEHYWFFNNGQDVESDVQNPQYQSLYGPAAGPTLDQGSIFDNPPTEEFLEDWLVRTCELVDEYKPKIVFFDWWIQVLAFKPYLKKFAAYYYNRAAEWGEEVAIDAKHDAYPIGSAVCDMERGQFDTIQRNFWQCDTSVAKNSWGYTVGNDYKTVKSIICDLVDIVSKNGALLLNIGPKPDGTIPDGDAELLRGVGNWLKVNGESIYNTHPWKVYGEGPTKVSEGMFTDTDRCDYTSEDIRYTMKGDCIYATIMSWPENGVVHLKELGKQGHFSSAIRKATILGYDVTPIVEVGDYLQIRTSIDADDMPVVIKFKVI